MFVQTRTRVTLSPAANSMQHSCATANLLAEILDFHNHHSPAAGPEGAYRPCSGTRQNHTAHSFIIEAIAEKAEQGECQWESQDTAKRRYAEVVASGKTMPWNEMRCYLECRLAGGKIARPEPRTRAR